MLPNNPPEDTSGPIILDPPAIPPIISPVNPSPVLIDLPNVGSTPVYVKKTKTYLYISIVAVVFVVLLLVTHFA